MLIYERYFARLKIQIINPPKYQKDLILGDIIESSINLKFDFYEDDAFTIQNTSLNLEIQISSIDLITSFENMVRFIEEITLLKNSDTSSHLSLFISIDGDRDDLGLYFTITKENNNLFIQIDRRNDDTIIVKMKMKDLRDALIEFAVNIQTYIEEMKLPKSIKDSLLNNIGML